MDRFGEKLRTLRKQHGLTVRELAAIFEMKSHSHIADMENGRSKPSVELLVKAELLERWHEHFGSS